MIDIIEFKVGDKYENMKGPYEVIAIDGDSMVIRWETGEEVTTDIDLQQRIQERLDLEKRLKAAAQKKKAAKPQKTRTASSRYGNKFNGFEEGDFKKNITATTWRSRNCLGGAVTEKLPSEKFSFNSWAVYRKPVIHWADVTHKAEENDILQAKFFAEVDEKRLCYGLYLEYPREGNDPATFISWLKDSDNEEWMCRTAAENDIVIYNLEEKGFKGVIEAHEGKWRIRLHDGSKEIDSLHAFLEDLPEDRGLDLNIVRIEEKSTVLEKQTAIAAEISSLFKTLMPLYEAVTPDIS